LVVKSRQILQLHALVRNRSNRVDRFRLRGCLKSRTGCKKALSVYAVNR
jgi:hypothetical protein